MAALAASASSAVFLFVTFRLTVQLVSVAVIGCWALIQGLLLVARVADSGAGANVTRYISHTVQTEGAVSLRSLVLAVTLICFLPVVLLAAAIWVPIYAYVSARYGNEVGPQTILDLSSEALIFACLSSAGSLLLSALEGYRFLVSRNMVTFGSNVVALALVVPLLRWFGASGLGASYIVQALVQLVGASVLLGFASRKFIGSRPLSVRDLVRLLWRENLQLSVVAIIQLCLEPVTKFYLGTTAGLSTIARFELALRVSTQIRVFFQASLQPLLAYGARRGGALSESARRIYASTQHYVLRISILLLAVQFLGAPVVSYLGLDEVSGQFLLYMSVLAAANSINAMGLTGYYVLLSGGELRGLRNILLQMAAISVAIGALGSITFGASVIVVGYALSIAWGGMRCLQLSPEPRRAIVDSRGIAVVIVTVCSLLALLGFVPLARNLGSHVPLVVAYAIAAAVLLLGGSLSILRDLRTGHTVTRVRGPQAEPTVGH